MRLIIAGGGTGGHIFPGIAVYEKLKGIDKAIQVVFIGSEKGMENRIKEKYDFGFFAINVKGFIGKNIKGKIASLKNLFGAAMDISSFYKKNRPDFVLGLGGYISFIPLAVARLKGIKCGLMEQNAIPGLSNRLLALLGITVFASFECTVKYFPFSKVVISGNPIRKNIMDAAARIKDGRERNTGCGCSDSAKTKTETEDKSLSIFVFGGSQGASSLNRAVMEALRLLPEEVIARLAVYHQTGDKDIDKARIFYERSGIKNYEVFAFTDSMEKYYSACDFVIGRAGAGTLSELVFLGKPAVLVPYPFAANGHQEKNASEYASRGCFYSLKDERGLEKELLETILKIFYNRELLKNMRDKLAEIEIKRDPAGIIADFILKLKLNH